MHAVDAARRGRPASGAVVASRRDVARPAAARRRADQSRRSGRGTGRGIHLARVVQLDDLGGLEEPGAPAGELHRSRPIRDPISQNDIDAEVLSELTDGDLEKFGVSLGHRKRLLKAIASLGSQEPAANLALPSRRSTHVPEAAERRQLTVMFCDLVGSTALSARLDPEDVREIVGAYHHCCADLIAKAGGFVAKYMGDGVLAYFGYPQAHEHDAERAVHAGLALVEAVPKLKTAAGVPLQVRVGIATGVVVVGDLIGSGEAQEQAVVGETPNLAARLQVLAEPNMVVIAEGTRRLLGNLFELQDLGAKDVKGIAGPVQGMGGAAREFRGEPLRRAAHDRSDRARRAGRRIRIAAAALVQRKDGSKARWCCSPARPASANRGSRRRFSNVSPASRTRGCAISARRNTRTAHFIRSSARWSAPLD